MNNGCPNTSSRCGLVVDHLQTTSIDPEGNTSTIDYDELITPVQLASSQHIPVAAVSSDLLTTSMTDACGNTSTTYTDGAGCTLTQSPCKMSCCAFFFAFALLVRFKNYELLD
jgi:hypothetical protein